MPKAKNKNKRKNIDEIKTDHVEYVSKVNKTHINWGIRI